MLRSAKLGGRRLPTARWAASASLVLASWGGFVSSATAQTAQRQGSFAQTAGRNTGSASPFGGVRMESFADQTGVAGAAQLGSGITTQTGFGGGQGGMNVGGMNMMGMGGMPGGFGRIGGIGGLGGLGGLGGFGGIGGFGRGGFGGMNQNQNQRGANQLQATVRVGFAPSPVAPSLAASRISDRVQRLDVPASVKAMQVEMQGRTAVLSGQVGSGAERRQAELLMMLEPGVDRVDNRLVVLEP